MNVCFSLASITDLWPLLTAQTWQITALALLVWLTCRTVLKDRPHVAHILWVLVLVKCVTPPVISSPTSAFSWLGKEASCTKEIAAAGDLVSEPVVSSNSTNIPSIYVETTSLDPQQSATVPTPRSAGNPVTPVAFSQVDRPDRDWNWIPLAIMFWLSGAALVFVVSLVRLLLFLRWSRTVENVPHQEIKELLNDLRCRLGVRRTVAVRVLRGSVGPAVTGLLRPTILLPAAIVQGKRAQDLEPLLAHELIHIRRGDLWWAALQTVARSIFWFHPLVSFASRMVTWESERSCDEETVASIGCDPASYATRLLEVLENKHQLRFAPSLPGVRAVDITSARLERVMKFGNGIHSRTPRSVWLLLLAGCFLALPGAAMVVGQDRVYPQPQPNPASPSSNELATQQDATPRQLKSWDIRDLQESFLKSSSYGNRPLVSFLGYPGPESTDDWQFAETAVPGHGIIKLGDGCPTFRIVGGTLYVFEPQEIIDEVAERIETYRKFGFNTITIETRMATVTREFLKSQAIDWSLAPVAGKGILAKDGTNPSTQSDPFVNPIQSPALVNRHAAKLVGLESQDENTNRDMVLLSGFEQNIATTSFVEKNSPVFYTLMSEDAYAGLFEALKSDYRNNITQAPTVTLFNGQNAAIFDGCQRPFVVGMEYADESRAVAQPVIRVISEGTMLKLNAEVTKDRAINLDCRMEFSSILDVDTVEVPLQTGGESTTSIQVPHVATTLVQSSLDVPPGKVLVLGRLENGMDDTDHWSLTFLKCRLIDGADVTPVEQGVEMKLLNQPLPVETGKRAYLVRSPAAGSESIVAAPQATLLPAKPTRIVIRAGKATGLSPESGPLVEALDSMGFAADIEGDVRYEIQADLPTITARDLTVEIGPDFQIRGDRGEIVFEEQGDAVFRFSGAVKAKLEGAEIAAGEVIYQASRGLQLKGDVRLEFDNGIEQTSVYSADQIVASFDSSMQLIGNARVIQNDQPPLDIHGDLIEMDMETAAIKASPVIPTDFEQLIVFPPKLPAIRR